MPFGIPSEDFHGGFGIPEPDENDYVGDKIDKVKRLLKEVDGVADNQEFGLSYSQAINYLEEIKGIIEE